MIDRFLVELGVDDLAGEGIEPMDHDYAITVSAQCRTTGNLYDPIVSEDSVQALVAPQFGSHDSGRAATCGRGTATRATATGGSA